MDLAQHVFEFSETLPKSETYGLIGQIRRAAVSIPANIAEGHGRETSGFYVQALRVSQGSLKELETHLLLAVRFRMGEAAAVDPLLSRCDEVGRMLRALIRAIQEKG